MTCRSRFRRSFWWCIRRVLSLRYRVTVQGHADLHDVVGPTVILPNHPAYVDPMIVQSYLKFAGASKPLVYAGTFRTWFLRPLMRVVRAVEVPDLQKPNRVLYRQTVQIIRDVAKGIDDGESYLIYPSGRLQRGTMEELGRARAASEIISRCPHVNIVLVRIEGLWGSMFSCAKTGELPNLGRTTMKALGWIAVGGVFFVPRRKVNVSVQLVDRYEIPSHERGELNRFLEDWFNINGPQKPTFVRYNWVIGKKTQEFSVAS